MTDTQQATRSGRKAWVITLKRRGGRKLFTGINFGETLESTAKVLIRTSNSYDGENMVFVSGRPATEEDFISLKK